MSTRPTPAGSQDPNDRAWLRAWREGVGLSRSALANQLGTSPDSIRRWEAGTSRPQARFRRPLADAMGLEYQDLCARLGLAIPASNVVALPARDQGGLTEHAAVGVSRTPNADQLARFTAIVEEGLTKGFAGSKRWDRNLERLARQWGIEWD